MQNSKKKPGRPSIGPQTYVALHAEDIAFIDTHRGSSPRAVWIRQAVTERIARVKTRQILGNLNT